MKYTREVVWHMLQNEAEEKFAEIFGRKYSGVIDTYKTDDADYIIITLGSIAGLCRETADRLRGNGVKAGVLRIRYMRPFPAKEIAEAVKNAKEKAIQKESLFVKFLMLIKK